MVAFFVRRRITLTIALIVTTVGLDMMALHAFPLDPLECTAATLGADLAIMCGLCLRAWAAGTIRKYKNLATTGPYAWIRHPLYLGSALILFGCCELMHGPLFALALVPLVVVYSLSIRQEERAMARQYGNQWLEYCRRVPMLIPRIGWPQLSDWSLRQALVNREHLVWLGATCGLVVLAGWRSIG